MDGSDISIEQFGIGQPITTRGDLRRRAPAAPA
jgi:hypothetical protein